VLRRDVIALIGAAAAWPLTARAQQPAIPIVGYIGGSSSANSRQFVVGFRAGLEDTGYVEGKNVAIEYRWAEGRYERIATIVDELVRLKVAVITTGGNVAALAAKRGVQTIPIVFNVAADPVQLGLVASLSRMPPSASSSTPTMRTSWLTCSALPTRPDSGSSL
jgi:putative ABC transport system substrate-binding protein